MRALYLLVLLAARPAVAAPAGVDLSEQFTPGLRDQGNTASCHAFASIALLEASLKRRGLGEEWLSSADLFVRVALKDGSYKIEKQSDGSLKISQKESGKPDDDLDFALDNGVASAQIVPWGVFHDAYEKERRERAEACARMNKDACPEDSLEEYIDKLEDDVEGREKRLLGDSPELEKDRKRIKDKLKGLSLTSSRRGTLRTFGFASPEDVADPAVCREKGLKQVETIAAALDAKVPVVICFDMDNLPGWDKDTKTKGKASHCVVAYGYSYKGEGDKAQKSFKMRNSWGGVVIPAPAKPGEIAPAAATTCAITYDVDEDHACAIHGVYRLDP